MTLAHWIAIWILASIAGVAIIALLLEAKRMRFTSRDEEIMRSWTDE